MGHIDDDEMQRAVVRLGYDALEMLIKNARRHMQPDGKPEVVNGIPETIEHIAQRLRVMQWPDPQARALDSARRDEAVQRLIRRARSKAPI